MLAALASCTSDNPEFDGEAGPVPMRGTDDGDSGVSGTSPSSGLVTTDSASVGESSSGASTSDDEVGSSEGPQEESGESTGAPWTECSFDKAPFDIEVANHNGELVEPRCTPLDLVGVVTVRADGSGLDVAVCDGACNCAEPGEIVSVAFGETGVVSDIYGGCRRVRVWATPDPFAVACDPWSGFSLEPVDGAPYVIGSNDLAVELPSLDAFVQLGTGEECSERDCGGGTGKPGKYALAVDGVEVWPEDEPANVTFDGIAYRLDNRSAHVTEECAVRVSWRAELR